MVFFPQTKRVRGRSSNMTAGQSLLLGLVLLSVFGCVSRPPLPPKAVELNNSGIRSLAEGDLEAAGASFTLALEYNPRFVEALSNLGLVELQRGNLTRAGQLLRRARRINPAVAQPHHGLGVLAEREGQPSQAARHYRAALAIDPGFIAARLNLARLLFEAGQLLHAKVEFEKLVRLDSESPVSHAGLAETLIRLGRHDEAETVIVEQAARFPDSAALQLLLARVELRRGAIEAAVSRLIKLTARRDVIGVSAFSWLAVAELARGRPRHAIGAAQRALALDKQASVARHALSVALERLGDPRANQWRPQATKPRE